MAKISFDDLVPKQGKVGLSFDDLIPAEPVAPVSYDPMGTPIPVEEPVVADPALVAKIRAEREAATAAPQIPTEQLPLAVEQPQLAGKAANVPLPPRRATTPEVGEVPVQPLEEAPIRTGGTNYNVLLGRETGMLTPEESLAQKREMERVAAERSKRTSEMVPIVQESVARAKEFTDETGRPLIDKLNELINLRDSTKDSKTQIQAQSQIRDLVKNAPKEFRNLLGGDIEKAAKDFAYQAKLAEIEVQKAPAPTQTFARSALETAGQTIGTQTADTIAGLQRIATSPISLIEAVTGNKDIISKEVDKSAKKLNETLGGGFAPDIAQTDDLGMKLVQGVASTAAFVGTGGVATKAFALPRNVMVAVAGGLPQAEQQWQEALRRQEQDPSLEGWRKWLSFTTGLGIGATEALPISNLFNRLEKATSGGLSRYLAVVAANSGEEGVQEALQTLLQNANSIAVLKDPNVTLDKDVAENALVGALAGMVFSGGLVGASAGANQMRSLYKTPEEAPAVLRPFLFPEYKKPEAGKAAPPAEAPPAAPPTAEAAPVTTVPDREQYEILKGAGFAVDDIADMTDAQRQTLVQEEVEKGTAPVALTEEEAATIAPPAPPAPPSPEAGVEAPGPEAAPAPEAPSAKKRPTGYNELRAAGYTHNQIMKMGSKVITNPDAPLPSPEGEPDPSWLEYRGPEVEAPEAPSARAQQLVEQGVAPLEAMQQAAAPKTEEVLPPVGTSNLQSEKIGGILGGLIRGEHDIKTRKTADGHDLYFNGEKIGSVEGSVTQDKVSKELLQKLLDSYKDEGRVMPRDPRDMTLNEFTIAQGLNRIIPQFEVDLPDFEKTVKVNPDGTFSIDYSGLYKKIREGREISPPSPIEAAPEPAAKAEVARIVSRRKGSKWVISGLDANGKKVFQLDPIQQSDVARDAVYRLVGENPKASLGVHKKITPDGMASIRVQGKPEGFSTLRGFIDRIGGIAEEGGELASRNIPKNLIREGGVSHEEATRRAIDAGFFPDYVPPALKAGEESYQAPPEMIDRFRDALGQRKFDLPKSAEAAEEARKRKEADIERDRLGPWIKDIKADLKARNRKMSDDDIRDAAIMLENGEADNVSDAIKIVHFQNDIELIGNDMADLDREVFSQILGDEMWDNMQSLADMRQEGELVPEAVEPLEMEGELEAQPQPDEAVSPAPREGGAAREKPAEEKAPEAVRAGVEAGRAGKPEEKVKEPSATKSDVERIQKMLDERLRPGYKVTQSARPADVGRGVLIADPVNKKPVFHLFEDIPAWIDSVIRLVPSEAKGEAIGDTGLSIEQKLIPNLSPKTQTKKNDYILKKYFTPGRIVRGYAGKDKIISFNENDNGYWSVTVQRIYDDGTLEDRVRKHSTFPEKRELAEVLGKDYAKDWVVTGDLAKNKALLDKLGFEPTRTVDGVQQRIFIGDNPTQQILDAVKKPAEEKGAEGKPQFVIPGAEKIGEKEQLERQAAKPMRGAAEQKEPGGMFGPTVGQKDLMDLAKEQPPMPKAVVEGKKPTQEEKAQRDEENIQSDIPPEGIAPPVPDISLADAQAILRGKKIEVKKVGDRFIVSGKTFAYKSLMRDNLGRWDAGEKAWSFTYDPTQNIAAAIKEVDAATSAARAGGEGAGAVSERDESKRISELRAREDARPDERITDPAAKVSAETKQLISNGLKFGIPQEVVTDQIEDVGMAVNAFEKDKPMFLLANEAGTGKTFVLGGIIRELRNKGVKKFAYVTQNQDLITQIKKDLAPYGVDDVQFVTYSKMDANVKDGILIFDEAHNVKNIGEGKGRAVEGQKMMQQAKMTIFASATPFQNPSETEYLSGTGLFSNVGGFADWAKAYGSNSRTIRFFNPSTKKEQSITKIYWVNTAENKKNGAAARQWFMKQGIMTQRAMKIDPKMVDVTFKREKVDEKWVDLYNRVMKAYETALNRFATEDGGSTDNKVTGEIMRHRESMVKRILEASKINAAIDRAKELLKEGKYVVIFVETKADRTIGRFRRSEHFKDDKLYTFPEMETMMREWNEEAGVARMNNEKAPPRPFAAFIYEIASAMHEANLDTALPSTADDILAGLGGEDKVAVYTGAVAGTTATKNKNDFMAGRKKVLIATMAKGGTGLSLHDTVGNRPTVQLNINLPWAAWQVDQVSARVARYGLKSKAMIEWMFASNIPWESQRLVPRVGARMADMGAIVKGIEIKAAEKLLGDFDFEGEMDVKQAQGEGKIQYSALPSWANLPKTNNMEDQIKRHRGDIQWVPISWLQRMPGNRLRYEIDELAEKISKNGINDPLIINVGKATRTAELGEGNHRLAALSRAGFTHAPVRVVVGYESGKGKFGSDYSNDLIPQKGEYFKADAAPSEVFKSLSNRAFPVKVEGDTQYSAFNSSIEPLIPDVINHIRSVISRMVGDKVAVKFYDKIIMENAEAAARSGGVEGGAAGGFYDNANGIIGLALDMESGAYPFDAMYHEVFHVLEDLLTPAEINALNRDADYIKNLVLSTYDQITPEKYDRLDIKEQRAYAMGAYGYRRDRKAPIPAGPARTILNKLYNIWKAITRAIRDVLGRRTAEDIFRDVYLGNLKYRMNDTIKDMNKVAGKAYAAVSGPSLPGLGPQPAPRKPVQQKLPGLPTPKAAAIDIQINRSNMGSKFAYNMLDRFIDIADYQKAIETARGAPLTDSADVYLALQLYQDRVIARQDKTWSEEVEPMIEALEKADVTVDDLGLYAYAKHAFERNEEMQRRDPARFVEGGSGLTDQEAQDILDNFANEGKLAALEQIAKDHLYPMIRKDVAARFANGLLTQDQYNQYTRPRSQGGYDFYVPLTGYAEDEAEATGKPQWTSGVGKGFPVYGKEYKVAFGRESLALNPVFSTVNRRMEGITRTEKQRVDLRLYNLVKNNPNPDFAEIVKPGDDYVKKLAPDGTVQYVSSTVDRTNPFIFTLKIGGKEVYIRFNSQNENMARFVSEMKGLGGEAGTLMKATMAIGRYFSKINTQWVPDFFLVNFPRDLQDALLNLYGTKEGLSKAMLANVAKSAKVIAKYNTGGELTQQDKALLEEWKMSGGHLDYGGFRTAEKNAENFEKRLKKDFAKTSLSQKGLEMSKNGVMNVLGAIETINDTFDSTVRFAVYLAARENGLNKERSALLSRRATVDFKSGGKYKPMINALYPFAGAALAGSRGLYRLAKSPRGRKAMLSIMLISAMNSLLGSYMSDDDEYDPNKAEFWTQIKANERTNSIILPIKVNGRYVKIPIGFYLQPFWVAGDQIMGASLGQIGPMDAAVNIATAFSNAFNPLGSGSLIHNLVPVQLRGIYETWMNEDWLGRQMHPERKNIAKSAQYYDKTSDISITLADQVNRLFGGNPYKPSIADIYPSNIDYWAGYITGGVGRFVTGSANAIYKWAEGEETPLEKLPVVRRFVTSTENIENTAYSTLRRQVDEDRSKQSKAISDSQDKTIPLEQRREAKELAIELRKDLGTKITKGRVESPLSSLPGIFKDTDKKIDAIEEKIGKIQVRKDISVQEKKALSKPLEDRIIELKNMARKKVMQKQQRQEPTVSPLRQLKLMLQ